MSGQVRNQQSHNIHFRIIIQEITLRDRDLMIPRSFVDQYGKELSNPVFLRLPNGVKWKVNWIKRDGDIWFKKIWERFAQHYSLSFGHFLLFRYERISNFQVKIFDMSAVEIDYSCIRCTNIDGEGTSKHTEDHVEKSNGFVEIIDDNERPRSSLAQPHKKMKTMAGPSNTKINLGFDASATRQNVTGGSKGDSFKARNSTKIEAILKRGPLEGTQSSTALKKAMNFQSEHPVFIQTLHPSYLQILVIPSKFSQKYLAGMEGNATIWVSEDRTWSVRFKFNVSNNRVRMTTGWLQFVQANNLKEGDVCAFEMIHRTKFSFKVNIFRAREEEPRSEQFQDAESPNMKERINKRIIVN